MVDAAERLRDTGVVGESATQELNYVARWGSPETLDAIARFLTDQYAFESEPTEPREKEASGVVRPESLMITNGVSHGIDLACAQLTKPGDIVVVELPTYFLAADVFRDNGLDVVGVDGLEEGIGPDGLPDGTPGYFDVGALERRLRVDGLRPRLVYLVPTHSNPRGGTLPERDRKRLVELAVEFNFYVLADEVYHLLHWGEEPPPPRIGRSSAARVVSVSSFTKILAPGLRVGWIETARSIVDTISDRGYVNSGGCVAPFAASIVVSAIENGSQARWLQRLRERYRGTSRALHDAASREKASTGWKVASCPPSGGYFLWIELPADCDERGVTRAAEDAGVAFLPGSRCVPGGTLEVPREERSCRLCFAYLDEEKIVEGVKRLAESVRNARGK
ncbi:aminotransferase [Micromonas commoda]|uniref:Aminotransferase n=1 Tax=Micromonas commoda (strain RCC299 / NOUM17 / CCMP2709) TaxID=296587 RepID=C1ECJ5_MICCC|nr:aminotransferase [Micromonas commoda]ACO65915.1 aminotransferase [Micromonas commoda]|eukprot:XP_002504657.1 aminotransferase [Micromonas commoda]